jgi:hypothetical protein
MINDENHWRRRAPQELLAAHNHVREVLTCLWTIDDALSGLTENPSGPLVWARYRDIAESTLALRTKLDAAEQTFAPVEEDFGAVAVSPIEKSYKPSSQNSDIVLFASSVHRLIIDWATACCDDLFDDEYASEDVMVDNLPLNVSPDDSVVQDVLSKGFIYSYASLNVACNDDEWLRISTDAEREFFRAWKHKYPTGTPYTPSSQQQPNSLVLTNHQCAILKALEGRALKKEELAEACKLDPSRLYRRGYLKELKGARLVLHKMGVGYYRPDAPPPDTINLDRSPNGP